MKGRSTNSALKFAGICNVFTMFLVGFTIDLLGFAVALLGFNHSAIRILIGFTGGYHVFKMVLLGFTMVVHAQQS